MCYWSRRWGRVEPVIVGDQCRVVVGGVGVKEPAHDVGGGRLVATFTDPDGNVLGLVQDQ